MFSPNPVVQQHAIDNPDAKDRIAIENLLVVRRFLPGYVKGDHAREEKKGAIIDKF